MTRSINSRKWLVLAVAVLGAVISLVGVVVWRAGVVLRWAKGICCNFQGCGPQKPLRVEICMTPGADSGLSLRLFQRTLFGVLALCEADLPCCLCLTTIQNAPGAVHTQEFADIRT
jgi:hypothetical protein